LEEANPKLGVGPRSTHFFILCIEDVMRIHPFDQMEDYGEVESNSYVLYFDIPKKHMEPNPSMAKMLYFQSTRNRLLICSLLLREPNQKFDVKLSKRLKSSRWCDKKCIVMLLLWSKEPQRWNDQKLYKMFKSSKWKHK